LSNYVISVNANKTQCIGKLKQEIINCLNVPFVCGKVYLYPGVINHVKKIHYYCYQNYLILLPDILKSPDYVGINQIHTDSIELVKIYQNVVLVVFCKSKFLTFANIFPQAPVGNFFVNYNESARHFVLS